MNNKLLLSVTLAALGLNACGGSGENIIKKDIEQIQNNVKKEQKNLIKQITASAANQEKISKTQ